MMFGWCSKTLSVTTIRVLTDSMIFTRFSFFLLLDQPVESKNDHKKSEFANVLSDELMLYKRGNVYILENSTHRFLLEANKGIDSHCPLLHRCLCFIPESLLVLHHHDNIHHDNILQNLLWTTVIVMLH